MADRVRDVIDKALFAELGGDVMGWQCLRCGGCFQIAPIPDPRTRDANVRAEAIEAAGIAARSHAVGCRRP